MKKTTFVLSALLLAAASCKKEDSTPLNPTPVITATTGTYSLAFNPAYFRVDSLKAVFAGSDGMSKTETVYGRHLWISPTLSFKKGGAGTAVVSAWGRPLLQKSDTTPRLNLRLDSALTLTGESGTQNIQLINDSMFIYSASKEFRF